MAKRAPVRASSKSPSASLPPGVTVIEGGSTTSVLGFAAGAVYAGIKTPGPGKLDLGILASDRPAAVAAMFTRSTVKGAAVIVSQQHARNGRARGVIRLERDAECAAEQIEIVHVSDPRKICKVLNTSGTFNPSSFALVRSSW